MKKFFFFLSLAFCFLAQEASQACKIQLVKKPNQSDYAGCAGIY